MSILTKLSISGDWEKLGNILANDKDQKLRNRRKTSIYHWVPAPLSLLAQFSAFWTPLQYASIHDYTGVACSILLKYNCDPNVSSATDLSPLHLAAYFNNIRVAQTLLSYRANPQLCDRYRRIPYDYARSDTMRTILKDAMTGRSRDSNLIRVVDVFRSPTMTVTEMDPMFQSIANPQSASTSQSSLFSYHEDTEGSRCPRRCSVNQQQRRHHKLKYEGSIVYDMFGSIIAWLPHRSCKRNQNHSSARDDSSVIDDDQTSSQITGLDSNHSTKALSSEIVCDFEESQFDNGGRYTTADIEHVPLSTFKFWNSAQTISVEDDVKIPFTANRFQEMNTQCSGAGDSHNIISARADDTNRQACSDDQTVACIGTEFHVGKHGDSKNLVLNQESNASIMDSKNIAVLLEFSLIEKAHLSLEDKVSGYERPT